METRKQFVNVPCDGCTLCCQGDAVRLLEEDDPKSYLTEPHPSIPGALMIAHKPNRDCIYLTDNGCSIHDHAPALCRAGDCRSLAFRYNFEMALKLHEAGRIDLCVWDRGNELIKKMKNRKKFS